MQQVLQRVLHKFYEFYAQATLQGPPLGNRALADPTTIPGPTSPRITHSTAAASPQSQNQCTPHPHSGAHEPCNPPPHLRRIPAIPKSAPPFSPFWRSRALESPTPPETDRQSPCTRRCARRVKQSGSTNVSRAMNVLLNPTPLLHRPPAGRSQLSGRGCWQLSNNFSWP